MTATLDHLIKALETSVKQNGPTKPVTLAHMLLILKLVQVEISNKKRREEEEIEYDYRYEINN